MKKQRKWWIPGTAVLCVAVGVGISLFLRYRGKSPEELLISYMDCISAGKYEKMYEMIDVKASGNISLEDFTRRNQAIYEGIEMQDMKISEIDCSEKEKTVKYTASFDTAAGKVSFENEASFTRGKEGCLLVWEDSLIFPELGAEDRVSVAAIPAERGEILDRNGTVLAGKGLVSSVGIVPGKLKDRESAISEISGLLEMDQEQIEEMLAEDWVTEASFVPLKTLPKVQELELGALEPDEEMVREKGRQQRLLEIPGVMISDKEARTYPLGEAAAHLVGYVQSVTAEDLEEHEGEGYRTDSVIGKTGIEALYEKELKGRDGCRICVVDDQGNEKTVLAQTPKEDGTDIRLTIDAGLQKSCYEQFQQDPGCSVAMDPMTGEVLALVSTPSYDSNDFILGLTDEQWTALNEDAGQPLYNRFREAWCPGSSIKPIIAAVGLKTGTLDPAEDFGNVGLSWQKDASWGDFYVTTLHAYEPVTMKNALIYSDNIYFAKAALKIGAENLENSLDELGFGQEIPFEILMTPSSYSNTGKIESEVQLADSGYGQGELLMNSLHLASLYTAFLNDGNVLRPRLQYEEKAEGEIWLEGAFSPEHVAQVLEGMDGVVNDPNGTGYGAHRTDIRLAGKTGTAELKESQEDTSGTEIGWFAVFTEEVEAERPLLLVSMVEDVKQMGGSGYVVAKDKVILDEYLGR